jgi:hypothetical protein
MDERREDWEFMVSSFIEGLLSSVSLFGITITPTTVNRQSNHQ